MHIWTKIGTGERRSNASSFDFVFENLVPGFYGKEVLRESRGRRKCPARDIVCAKYKNYFSYRRITAGKGFLKG